ncbi:MULTISPECIES: AMP-binding protein [Bradyrhizobium]|jgi:acyl-CoA synthetase (AMP-forming)/AMP-acid ligase II/thioesterase domain-containing protein|uniref:AMP-binding protein n=1 Tax=Bradyrhizobium TaxID=374 RepID=UPI0004870498|nr:MULTISPECIES: AMP-binding protein [Bradyrhizobium]MCS3453591.1 acyl-CoA synthetase (AMP-forming)/AMP-acid ligase II/thioesterase domain-containing protein [Bradyrhizobium elkanii]MCS3564301.1 acyl-CoA synthetase (AMP-forming)/AMP-acid ligase II/thioesterase domain-containing protein [Bradyrhizobium elkanii]MCW2145867.1 acyl-CoA synthetase (AMP-forming)/AMP-acid ligase II/thioesterase domain-containing protein [Bradyrhizobium elkanii]MCW2355061.1 acyl-CoA synthetase (AMP-forming)/AMP-acid lig
MLLDNETPAATMFSESVCARDRGESEARLTIGQVIGRTASRFPNQPAIVSSAFEPLSYSGLERQLNAFRRRMRLAGFDCNARIGVLMPNGPEAVLAIVSVACCTVAVPLDPRLSQPEIEQRLDMLSLSALVVLQGSAPEARQAAACRTLAIIEAVPVGQGQLGLEIAVQVSGSPAVDAEPDPRSPAFILQTSGTTAQPKLIPFSHDNMLAAAERLRAWFGLTSRDRCLSVSPPYYSHGLKVTVFTPLLTGGSIAIPANNAIVALDEWFDVLRPTWYSAGPTLHATVLDKAQSLENAGAAHTLRFAMSGGAPLPRTVQEGLQHALGVPVLEHYGSSEAAQIAANQLPPGPNRPGTCGRPWPDTVAIVGEDGHPLAAGERGEIWIRGPTVTSGYLDAPELNQAAFTKGWFHTGDIGSLDEDGFLSLHGRLSELINRGGEKISPAEIEAALLRHSAVAEAAAFAISHPRLGEDVAVAIVPHRGAQPAAAELRQFLQRELASFKIPRRILTLDHLPKGVTGKVQRRRLRELVDRPRGHLAPMPAPVANGPLNLEAELLTLWRRLLKNQAVTVDSDFFASGGDSLLAMEMLIEVERLVGYPVPETIMFGAETIRQFAARVSAPMDTWATAFFQPHACGTRSPLYFFNGDLVSGHASVRRLVELLGPDYPIISINPHGLHGEPIPASIEAMAADRLPFILARQASGPFLLGGKCNGAMVAFEVARQLMAAGHTVDLVTMVDPPTVSARPVPRAILRLLKPLVSPYLLRWTFEQMVRLERYLKLPANGQTASAKVEIPAALWDAHSIAMAQYCPAPLEIPVAFYAADHDGRAWRHLSSQLELIQVPGGHPGCLLIGAELLVDHLRRRFEKLTSGSSAT